MPRQFPHGANVSAPAQLFLTVHGTTADLLDAATLQPVGGSPPSVTLDMTRRQITVVVPHSSWNPTGQVVRLAAGVGLWNTAQNNYRIPSNNPNATQGGGASGLPNAPAFYNVAFRFNEPMPDIQSPTAVTDPAWWRENAQAHALTTGDISPFFANVDFNKLAAEVEDDMPGQPGGVPQTGPMNRILASHFETEQGAAFTSPAARPASVARPPATTTTGCKGWYRGQLQPYAIYVPEPADAGGRLRADPAAALAERELQPVPGQRQPVAVRRAWPGVDRDHSRGPRPGRLVLRLSGADTFEVWADVAARYRLDPDWTTIAGYSMGGYGTYKFATQFPDLFAKAQPTVGPPGLGVWAPPADPQPGRRQVEHESHARLGAKHPVPDVVRGAGRACPRRERADAGGQPRLTRIPLRVRPLQPGRAPHARRQRRIRPGCKLPRHDGGRPQPGARHVRLQPDHGLPGRPDRRRSRVLGLGSDASQRVRHRAARDDRRAVARLRCRRPGAVGNGERSAVR